MLSVDLTGFGRLLAEDLTPRFAVAFVKRKPILTQKRPSLLTTGAVHRLGDFNLLQVPAFLFGHSIILNIAKTVKCGKIEAHLQTENAKISRNKSGNRRLIKSPKPTPLAYCFKRQICPNSHILCQQTHFQRPFQQQYVQQVCESKHHENAQLRLTTW